MCTLKMKLVKKGIMEQNQATRNSKMEIQIKIHDRDFY